MKWLIILLFFIEFPIGGYYFCSYFDTALASLPMALRNYRGNFHIPIRAGRMKRGYKRRKCAPLVDYRAFGAGVLIQSGGKRLRARCPQPLVEVPDIQFDLFFEIIHPMCAGYTQ
jgi:hypothetical protein